MAIYKKEHFGIARKIVSNMTSESWEQIPHMSASYEADVTDFLKECKKLNAGSSEKITINTVMMKVICEGLKAAPKMNTTLDFNRNLVRGTLNYHDQIDISMPTMLSTGEMMTLNMHDMGNKTLEEMAAAVNDTIRRANNSDMNEVMFEVSMDNTVNGLKKGKLKQTLCRLFGCRASIRFTLCRAKQRKIIMQSPKRIGSQSMISSRAQPQFQTSAPFAEIKRECVCCLKLFRRKQRRLPSMPFRNALLLLQMNSDAKKLKFVPLCR